MNKKRTSLRSHIIKVICLLFAIMCTVLILISYKTYYDSHIDFYYEKAQGIVRMLASQVDGDRIEQYVETGSTDEHYEQLLALFNAAKESTDGLAYLYLMKPYEEHFVYVLEARTPQDDPNKIADLGDSYSYSEVEYKYLVPDIQNKSESSEIVYGADTGYGKSISVWAPVLNSQGEVAAMVEADYVLDDVRRQINIYAISVLIFLALSLVVIAFIMLKLIEKEVVNPILKLNDYVNSYEKGNVADKPVQLKDNNEIQWLADSFHEMIGKIKEYVENIEKVTAEKERIGAELSIATQIQGDMLPCIFPPFPGRKEIDLYASMTPAKEVGGDFYDFFLIDDGHLALVIADVSGKGVPAALFMVVAKTLLKNRLQLGESPARVLEAVNNQLCENNESGMFVTAWVGVYDIAEGILTAANAGHEYPAICRAGGTFELYKDTHGFVLAGMEDMIYTEYQIPFQAGDTLFVYTDGVPEATNIHQELMGTDLMIEKLNRQDTSDLRGLLHGMKQEIDAFAGEAPQFDDITMLTFRVNKREE